MYDIETDTKQDKKDTDDHNFTMEIEEVITKEEKKLREEIDET